MVWRDVAIRPLSNKFILESEYMHIYSNTSLIIAQTTQYRTFVVYLTSFQEIPDKKLCGCICYLGILKGVYQQICMDFMFGKALQMESRS